MTDRTPDAGARAEMQASARPSWMDAVVARLADDPDAIGRLAVPPEGARESAVLMLFGPHAAGGEDVLLTERAHDMRSHPGQVSFPGGALEPGDDGPVGAALREASEEVGLDPASVEVVATFPALFLPPSGFLVTPVLAWWTAPHPLTVIDRREVERVARVPIAALRDQGSRFTVTHPSGYTGGAFDAEDLFVWGFTAMVLDGVLDLAGLSVPWDRAVHRPLPERFLRASVPRRGVTP